MRAREQARDGAEVGRLADDGLATTRSSEEMTVGRLSTSSSVTVADTSRRSGVAECSPSRSARAIEKQEACAAAASSSGLVLPSGCCVRAAQVTGSSPRAPVPDVTVPVPLARLPSQMVCAVRFAIAMSLLCIYTRCFV
jgi:hypothetical protein